MELEKVIYNQMTRTECTFYVSPSKRALARRSHLAAARAKCKYWNCNGAGRGREGKGCAELCSAVFRLCF